MKGRPPNTAVSLRMMSNCIGGREKPWGAILKAMIEGKISYWLKSDDVTTHQILIEPRERQALMACHFDRSDHPHYEFEENLTTFDVAEILNLQPRENLVLREAGIFDPCKPKHSFDYDRCDVLALARQWVSVTELIRRYDMNDRVVKRQLAAAGVASKLSLWERKGAEAECLKWKMGVYRPS